LAKNNRIYRKWAKISIVKIIALVLVSRLVEKAEKERAGSTRALSVKLKALEALIESKRRSSRPFSSASLQNNSMDSD
jgi:hypothetical protein